MEAKNGVRMFCTTAGATSQEEEVLVNPLPDQMNLNGSDPEETDSDLEEESSDDGTTDAAVPAKSECEEESSSGVPAEEASDYEDPAPAKCKSTRKKSRQSNVRSGVTRRGRNGYNVDLASAIAVNTQLTPCDISAIELLTFFPHHTQYPEAGLRLYRNGWTTLDIAKMQLHARGRLSKASCSKRIAALRHQVLTNGTIFFNDPNFPCSSHSHVMTAVTSYDASHYQPRAQHASSLATASLVDIAQGVVNWPTG